MFIPSGLSNVVAIAAGEWHSLALTVEGRVWEVQFDDWMYLLDGHHMLNKAVMSKFGFALGEVTLAFYKP